MAAIQAAAAAETPAQLLYDVSSGTQSADSWPSNFVVIGGEVFFRARDTQSGAELWKSDGTAEGTVRVRDIRPGAGDSSPQQMANVDDSLYFLAHDGVHGAELWKSDGTEAGTNLVKDIYPGYASSSPTKLINLNGKVLFVAAQADSGRELWTSDGTETGTRQVKDIREGSMSSYPGSLTTAGGLAYFSADDGLTGNELWKSDGTPSGTSLLRDLAVGPFPSNPEKLTDVGGTLYFVADNGVNGDELWKSDGTTLGTVLVKDITLGKEGSSPEDLTAVGNTLYFATRSRFGETLWKTDGTDAGTVVIPGLGTADWISGLTSVNGVVYFFADTWGSGTGLWRTDGTKSGTVKVTNLDPGSFSIAPPTVADGALYFWAHDAQTGTELWRSDGTAAGTVRVKDINAGEDSASEAYLSKRILNFHGILVFAATDGQSGAELWRSDGTDAGTYRVKDIEPVEFGFKPAHLTKVGSRLYFTLGRTQLWTSEGLQATLLKDYSSSGMPPYSFDYLTDVGGTLFFHLWDYTADNTNDGIWMSDGTGAGTVKWNGAFPVWLGQVASLNGTLLFTGEMQQTGFELWKGAGGFDDAVLVKDLMPGPEGSYIYGWAPAKHVLFFEAWPGEQYGLWKSDGTEAGTQHVKSMNVYAYASDGYEVDEMIFASVGDTLFFVSHESAENELWKSDGTSEGTVLVKDINPKDDSISPSIVQLTATDDLVFFIADDGLTGDELWRSDGTEAGTFNVTDIARLEGDTAHAEYLTALKCRLFFSMVDEQPRKGLWVSDGTKAGTILVREFDEISEILPLPEWDLVLLSASAGDSGQELWISDGTREGTVLVQDIHPGSAPSSPSQLTRIGQWVYFVAHDGQHGVDPWVLDLTTLLEDAPPIAESDRYVGAEGGMLSNENVLANDHDPEGKALSASVVAGPSHGTLTLRGDGSFVYVHDGSETRSDTFTYRAYDGVNGSAEASVSIQIQPVNDPPMTVGDSYVVSEGGTLAAASVLANDSDPDSTPAAVLATSPSHGTLTFNSDGTFQYVHDGGESTRDEFTYKARDGSAESDTALVAISINGTNDAPLTEDDYALLSEDGNVLIVVLENDTDPEGDSLSISSLGVPSAGGTVTVMGDRIHYSPARNFNGTETFIYTASDGTLSDTATVTVTVTAVNDVPEAKNDSAGVNEDSGANYIDVLGNDVDRDGDALTVTSAGTPSAGGHIDILMGGAAISYTPPPNFSGAETFVYTVSDGVDSSTATVTATIAAVNDPPSAADDAAAIDEDGSALINVLSNDRDVDGDHLLIAAVGESIAGGTVVLEEGQVRYRPAANFHGTEVITYTVSDGINEDAANITITVNAVNDSPAAQDDMAAVLENGSIEIDVLANDSDADGEALEIAAVGVPMHGTASIAGRRVLYQPAANYHGPDGFSYMARDSAGAASTATVSVTVTEVAGSKERDNSGGGGLTWLSLIWLSAAWGFRRIALSRTGH